MTTTKDSRLAVRLSSDQRSLIDHAAEVVGTNITDFTVAATVARANDVLADRRVFAIEDVSWNEFLVVLDRPVTHRPRLAALLRETSIFDEA